MRMATCSQINGTVHQLKPTTGERLHSLVVSSTVDEEVRLTVEGQMLVAACHGYAYGIRLSDWSKPVWSTALEGKLWKMADVIYRDAKVYACSNGYIQHLDPNNGSILNSMQLSSILGSGDYTPSLSLSMRYGLFVGMHGYVYNLTN